MFENFSERMTPSTSSEPNLISNTYERYFFVPNKRRITGKRQNSKQSHVHRLKSVTYGVDGDERILYYEMELVTILCNVFKGKL